MTATATASPDRIQTPYAAMTTPEVVAARRSLALAIAGDGDASAGPVGDLVVWATVELAERLSAFVEHVDGAVFGPALEALALDCGIVRGPKPVPGGARASSPTGSVSFPARTGLAAPRGFLLRQPDGSLRRFSP